MSTITRFVPFRSGLEDMAQLHGRLSRLLDGEASGELAGSSFVPAVDVYEDETKLVLKLEVPGVKQEDLDLRIENLMLTVRGQRRFEKDEKEENFHRIERRFGSFTRSFSLPRTVDPNDVTATYQDGVLAVQLAKRAEAKPRQIEVKLGQAAQPKQVEGTTQQ